MDLKQLKYFLQITDSGSFSEAARILRIAQPALSLQLKNLEEELGTTLLVRHARGVTPTDLGTNFYQQARRILRQVDEAKEEIRSRVRDPVGQVSVGLPTSACRGLWLHLMKSVASKHPRISIHLVEAMSGSLDEWTQAGRLDVALLYDHRAYEHVAWTEMMEENLLLIAPPGADLGGRTSIEFAEVARYKLVLPGHTHVIRNVIESCAARAGIKLNVTVNCDSLQGLIQMVRNGYFTLFPHFGVAEELERGDLIAVELTNPIPSWRLSVVVSQRTVNSRASDAVATILANEIKALVESGAWRAKLKERV